MNLYSPRSPGRIRTKPAWYRTFLLRTANQIFSSICSADPVLPCSLLFFPLCHCFVICALVICHSSRLPSLPYVATSLCRQVTPSSHVLDTPSAPAHCRIHRGADLSRVRAGKLAESSALVRGRPFEPAPGNAGEGSLHFFLPFFPAQPKNG